VSRRGRKAGPLPRAQPPDRLPLQAELKQGMALLRQGRLADAERVYAEILRQQPDHFDALHFLGVIAVQNGQVQRGVELISRAIELDANVAEAHGNLGDALRRLGRHEDALASYDRAIALRTDLAQVYCNRGNALTDLERPKDALASYDRAIALKPDYATAYSNRGVALQDLQRLEEALPCYDKALALNPDYVKAYSNRGVVLRDLNRPKDALASYDKAIALRPDDVEANWNRSLCLLLTGDFERGWQAYEWRKKQKGHSAKRSYPQPLWSGAQDLAGKTLFLYWEQGLGDTIQFCRYARLVEARGAKVVLSVQGPLRRLLSRLSPTVQILGAKEEPADFDYHAPLLSLPLAFGTTSRDIPAEVPYLSAEQDRIDFWKDRLGPDGFKIGICWQGRVGKVDIGRSFAVTELYDIAAIAGVRLISLQKGEGAEQMESLAEGMRIETLGADFDAGQHAFLDTAAVMEHMDLNITSDTSVAHLAGALGRPAWVALKHVPDWRWRLEGSGCPWYPTLRLFRQRARGDWKFVFREMEQELSMSLRRLVFRPT